MIESAVLFALVAAVISASRSITGQVITTRTASGMTTWMTTTLAASAIALLVGVVVRPSCFRFLGNSYLVGSAVLESLGFLLYFQAVQRCNVTVAEPLAYLQSVIALAAEAIWLGSRPSVTAVVGVVLAVSGGAIVAISEARGSADRGGIRISGVIFVLMAAVSWAATNVLLKPLLTEGNLTDLNLARCIVAGVTAVPFAFQARRWAAFQSPALTGLVLLSGLQYVLMITALLMSFLTTDVGLALGVKNSSAVFTIVFYYALQKMGLRSFPPVPRPIAMLRLGGAALLVIAVIMIASR